MLWAQQKDKLIMCWDNRSTKPFEDEPSKAWGWRGGAVKKLLPWSGIDILCNDFMLKSK